MKRSFAKIWAWPLAIAVSTLLGLIVGLVGDGGWDAVAAFALGVPALAAVWFSTRRRRRISRAP